MFSLEEKFTQGLAYIEKAERYPFNADYPEDEAAAYTLHGQILHQLGRNEEALAYFRRAMVVLAGDGGITEAAAYPLMHSDSIIDLEQGFALYAARAKLLQEMDLPLAALADLRQLFQLQDQQRERVDSDDSRYLLSAEVRTYYNQAIDLLYQLHQAEGKEAYLWEAFMLSEAAKAYSQLAALQRSEALRERREFDLQRAVAVLERVVAQQPEKAAALAEAKLRLSLIRRSSPDRELKRISPLDREKISAFLKDQQLDILEFHLNIPSKESTTTGSYVFHVTPDGAIKMIELAIPPTLFEEVIAWRTSIQQSAYRKKSLREDQVLLDEQFLQRGSDLRNALLPGIAEGNTQLGERLCIIPDGVLNYVPFAALPLASTQETVDYGTLPYLQSGRALQLAYSVRYLLRLQERESPAFATNLLAFAPSFSGASTPGEVNRLRAVRSTTTSLAENRTFPGLTPLVYNRSEVEAIANLLPRSEAYYDEAATKQAFVKAVGNSRIVHLSSHGMANPDNAKLSFIAFAQAGETLEERELLYFNDLSTLPLESELVVLSACETSIGQVLPGETVLSLGSAFAAAGAKSTLTSLWKVDDAATEDLMISFYEQIALGTARAEALAFAQQRQRETGEFAHPYYWSAMTLNGVAGPIELERGARWPLWLGAAALLLGLAWGSWRRWA
ncbi:MAG: CHAT domain-containing protein, partial [Bacteroidota bacterium]